MKTVATDFTQFPLGISSFLLFSFPFLADDADVNRELAMFSYTIYYPQGGRVHSVKPHHVKCDAGAEDFGGNSCV